MPLWHIDPNLDIHPVTEVCNTHLPCIEIEEELIAAIYRNDQVREHIEFRLQELSRQHERHTMREIAE